MQLNNLVTNPSRTSKFFNTKNERLLDDISEIINAKNIRLASLASHISNSYFYVQCPDTYTSVLDDLVPIPPRTSWRYSSKKFSPILKSIANKNRTYSVENIVEFIIEYKKKLNLVNLTVELSGGLDSSIVIQLLRSAGIEPNLVGFQSKRYEFRTESRIQDIIKTVNESTILMADDKSLPYSNLLNVPVHPLPNKSSIFYGRHKSIAEASISLGSKLILNGMGGDFLFCPAVPHNDYPLEFYRWQSDDYWANEYIYRQYGCEYISPMALKPFPNIIASLRRGMNKDTRKTWARKFFREILPRELVEYAYKGSFDGVYEEGLKLALGDIQKIGKVAFEVTKNSSLDGVSLLKLAMNSLNNSHEHTIEFMGKISFGIWIYSLVREGVI